MNKNKVIVLLGVVMVLLVAGFVLVQAQSGSVSGSPSTHETAGEANGNANTARLEAQSEYAGQVIPATGSSTAFCVLDGPDQAEREEIIRKHGSVYWTPCEQ